MRRRSRSLTTIIITIRPSNNRGPVEEEFKMHPARLEVPTISERLLAEVVDRRADRPTRLPHPTEEEEEPPTVWTFHNRQEINPGIVLTVFSSTDLLSNCPGVTNEPEK